MCFQLNFKPGESHTLLFDVGGFKWPKVYFSSEGDKGFLL